MAERLARIKEGLSGHVTKPMFNPLVQLRKAMEAAFDVADLEELAFGLSVDLENIKGQTKRDLIVNLITYFQKTGELRMLIRAAHEARPKLNFLSFGDFGSDI